jgi:hypothetical protein
VPTPTPRHLMMAGSTLEEEMEQGVRMSAKGDTVWVVTRTSYVETEHGSEQNGTDIVGVFSSQAAAEEKAKSVGSGTWVSTDVIEMVVD